MQKINGADTSLLWTQRVKPDLDHMHFSATPQEFRAKSLAILEHWVATGVTAATTWQDKKGTTHSLNTYFQSQWLEKASELHFGHERVLPTTNNCTEVNIPREGWLVWIFAHVCANGF